jgi:sugar lactone lactonase YvrE
LPGFGAQGQLSSPRGVALLDGVIYVTDFSNNIVHRIACSNPTPSNTPSFGSIPSGSNTATPSATRTMTGTTTPPQSCVVDTLSGSFGGFLDGPALTARYNSPSSIVFSAASAQLVVTDTSNQRVRTVSLSGACSTLAGNGLSSSIDGSGTLSSFSSPTAMTALSNGTLFVADSMGSRLRRIDGLAVSTLATAAGSPEGIAVDEPRMILYFSETSLHRISARSLASGAPSVVITGKGVPGFLDGASSEALFSSPSGLVFSAATGLLFIADRANHRIRSLNPTGGANSTVSTAAGNGLPALMDGSGLVASFNGPTALALSGRLVYIADTSNSAIRVMDIFTSRVSTVAGNGLSGTINGVALGVARLSFPRGVAIGGDGVVYVADTGSNLIRRVTCPLASPTQTPSASVSVGLSASSTSTVSSSATSTPTPSATPSPSSVGCFTTRIAGSGGCCAGCDNCVATSSFYSTPSSIAFDS